MRYTLPFLAFIAVLAAVGAIYFWSKFSSQAGYNMPNPIGTPAAVSSTTPVRPVFHDATDDLQPLPPTKAK
ncbi:hypothetical protein KW797_02690 [Candidatus Parcubacteria bacterium]|nr:hypothetical protein [Candidatus Parcubacteria bacterium]